MLLEFNHYKDLPFPVFVTDTGEQGLFGAMNEAAIALFFPSTKTKPAGASILDFYKDRGERKFILEHLQLRLCSNQANGENKWEMKKTLEFIIEGTKYNLRFYGKPLANESGSLAGCLCMAFPIPEIDKFHLFEDELDVGIFEIGIKQEITYANNRFCSLLNIEPAHWEDNLFLISRVIPPKDLSNILNEMQELPHKSIYHFNPVVLNKKDNGRLLADMTIQPHYSPGGKLIKCRGILKDLSDQEIIANAPIGIYMVMPMNGQDVIVKANRQFARIHEFDRQEDCIGFPVREMYPNQEAYSTFLDELARASRGNNRLENHELEIVTRKGNKKILRVNTQNIYDRGTHLIIGRIGTVYDINNAVDEARKRLEQGFADFLHDYYHHLLNIQSALLSIVAGHGTDVVKDQVVDIDAAARQMNGHIKTLHVEWTSFLQYLNKENIPVTAAPIEKKLAKLNANKEQMEEKANWVRLILIDIRSSLREQFREQPIAREKLKSVERTITEILRFARLVSMGLLINDIKPFLEYIDSFEEVVRNTTYNEIPFEKVDIAYILNESVKSLTEYAQRQNVAIKRKVHLATGAVNANAKELERALYNILHNAIKYSRTETKVAKNEVEITVSESGRNVVLEFINLGVPIRKKELEEKLIFDFSYRGASASENREGSGIGLWSAKKIIDAHNGKIAITSQPTNYNQETDYTKWFKTTVKIEIPLAI